MNFLLLAVHSTEYAFGAHEFPASGIFEVDPHECPGFKYRKSILMGYTNLDDDQVRDVMELHTLKYHGNTYHLIYKNCNHFSADLCRKLTGNPIPKWVNRLAKIGNHLNSPTYDLENPITDHLILYVYTTGSKCSTVLPRALKGGTDSKIANSETMKLKTSNSCLSSIWITYNQKEVKLSSQLINGCLPQ